MHSVSSKGFPHVLVLLKMNAAVLLVESLYLPELWHHCYHPSDFEKFFLEWPCYRIYAKSVEFVFLKNVIFDLKVNS